MAAPRDPHTPASQRVTQEVAMSQGDNRYQRCGFRLVGDPFAVDGGCVNPLPCGNPDHQPTCEITVGFDEKHKDAVECVNSLPCPDHASPAEQRRCPADVTLVGAAEQCGNPVPCPYHAVGRPAETDSAGEIEFAAMLADAQKGRTLPPLTASEIAVRYLLNRRQTDPDLGYLIGRMTESFHLLCVAEAETTGLPLKEVEAARLRDMQPEHRKRDPEVLTLRKELETLRG